MVSFLEEPLKSYTSIAYLICRVVDNIEDCSQTFHWKEERFNEFFALLEKPNQAPQVLSIWTSKDWPGLTVDEMRIMTSDEGFRLWQLYAQLPDETRQIIRSWTLEMAQGMLLIEDRGRINGWSIEVQ